ncbi:hypothetical protein [Shewanella frigidimarina]|uniref:hypothetical protein n=1 Tax=Shewanella frigidimarina TaxID=56812 RepID=UPI003D7C0208
MSRVNKSFNASPDTPKHSRTPKKSTSTSSNRRRIEYLLELKELGLDKSDIDAN